MPRLHTANRRRRKARAMAVYLSAFQFHTWRVERLSRSGRLDRLASSGFVRRQRRKQKL